MPRLLYQLLKGAVFACGAVVLGGHAKAAEVTGTYRTAVWPWWNPAVYSFETRAFRAFVGPSIINGNFYLGYTNVSWFQGWDNQPLQADGRYSNFSGVIYAAFHNYTSPHAVASQRVLSATFANGSLVSALGGKEVNNTGKWAAYKIKLSPDSRDKMGGPVEIATGAESFSRPLFRFEGARNWGLVLSYNSILAADQTAPDELGFGWSHPFMARVRAAGSDLILAWDATRTNTFMPKTAEAGTFVSTEDATRYDILTAQPGGGWLLTRRDQSSLLFGATGFLVEDRDANGRRLVVTYVSGRIGRVADLVSNTRLDFGYDGSGRLVTLTDAAASTVTLGYNAAGLLSRLTNQGGKKVDFAYNGSRGLTTLTDHDGAVLTANTYDLDGRVTAQEDGVAGNPLTFGYQEHALPGNPLPPLAAIPAGMVGALPDGAWWRIDTSAGVTLAQPASFSYVGDQLSSITVNGEIVTLSYAPDGTLRSATNAAGVTSPADPRIVVTVTDRSGRTTTQTFNPDYRLRSVTDGLNQTTSYSYDAQGNPTSVTDGLGRTIAFTYDARGNLLTRTDAAGKLTTFTYDGRNNLLATTDAANRTTSRTYDPANNLLTFTDALGRTTAWTYNANSQPLTMTLPGGGVYSYAYTAGRLSELKDPNGVLTRFGYDANGRLSFREDGTGKRTTHAYDAVGNLLSVTNALNQITLFAYDHRNRLLTKTDPAGATTTYTYDANNKLLTTTDALGKITRRTYDGEGRLLNLRDPLNRTTTFAYDPSGRLNQVTNPDNLATSLEYDAAGQLVAVQDALGHRAVTTYDRRNLPLTVTDPLAQVTAFTYDDLGRRVTAKDPLTRTTTFAYDALHRLASATDPAGLTASHGFDADGNRTAMTNPATHATGFGFDSGGRLVRVTTPEGRATTLTYNPRGLPATVAEPSGQVTTLGYDDAMRVASLSDEAGSISFTHDAAGRILTVAEGTKTLTREYDRLGRLTKFTDGDGQVLRYAYNDAGQLTRLTYPDLKEVTYAYTPGGRLHTVTDWANRVTTYSYDAVGRVTQTQRPNGTKQTRHYDAAGQLTQLRELAADGTTVLYSASHSFDAAGQLRGTLLGNIALPLSGSATQTFDRDNRLLTHNGGAAAFDADGNLLAVGGGIAPASFTYDARNRLTGAGGLSYRYDAEQRRVGITGAAGTTSFVVNPNAALDQVLVRTAPDGSKTFYVYGLGLLHEETGATVRYYHHDRRGDTVMLTDAAGVVTDRVGYGVHGEVLSRTGGTNTPFLFSGRWGVQTDANGLSYHRARYYHPQLRRFLNQDAVLGSIATPASMNRFAYANGDPVSLVDPFGLAAQDVASDLGNYLLSRAYWTKVLDNLQTALDLVGLIPAAGEFADGINAAIYAARGDYVSSGLSATAMLPLGGQAATMVKLGLKNADEVAGVLKQVDNTAGDAAAKNGSFSVIDWKGYPTDLPKPAGPMSLLEAAEYTAARRAADTANNSLRLGLDLRGVRMDIHEIQPVKFGGNPTDLANKMVLPRGLHRQEVTPFWNQLQRDISPFLYRGP